MRVKTLRDYQARTIDAVVDQWTRVQATCVEQATGLGKTVQEIELGVRRQPLGRCILMVHSEELVKQAAEEIYNQTGERPGIEAGERYSDERDYHGVGKKQFVVGMVQSLIAPRGDKRRMDRFNVKEFATCIVDEVHRYASDQWSLAPMHFLKNPDLRLCGFSATLKRTDRRSIRKFVSTRAMKYDLIDAVRDGWLCQPIPDVVTVQDMDFSDCKLSGDDFDKEELSKKMEGYCAGIAKVIVEKTAGMQTIIFGPTVEYCEKLAVALNHQIHGSAICVFGKTEKETERPFLIEQFKWGNHQYILNVNVFTEGFNVPGIACVVPCPTKSFGRFMQQIGRGTRPEPGLVDRLPTVTERLQGIAASGKPYLKVLDLKGVTDQHGLISTFDVFKGKYSEEVVARAVKDAKDRTGDGAPVTCDAALKQAQRELEEENRKRDAALSAPLRDVKVTYTSELRDPFGVFGLRAPRKDGFKWGPPATPKMVASLERDGIDAKGMTRADAGRLIGEIKRRKKLGLCDLQRAAKLKAMGIRARDVSNREADRIIASGKAVANMPNPAPRASNPARDPNGPCSPQQATQLARFNYPTDVTWGQAAEALREINQRIKKGELSVA